MFYENLKFLRIKSNLTQKQLAEHLSLSPGSIGMYEQGRRSPDYQTIQKIASYFNVSIDFLLGSAGVEFNSNNLLKNNQDSFLDKIKILKLDTQENLTNTLNYMYFIFDRYIDDPNALSLLIEILNKFFTINFAFHTAEVYSLNDSDNHINTLFNIYSKYKNDINILMDKLMELNLINIGANKRAQKNEESYKI